MYNVRRGRRRVISEPQLAACQITGFLSSGRRDWVPVCLYTYIRRAALCVLCAMAVNWRREGIQVFKTSKDKDAVGFNGYIYRQHERPKEGATKRRWICNSTNRCTGKLWTDLGMTQAVERGGHKEHCHPDPERVKKGYFY